jgi:hypothetical protein
VFSVWPLPPLRRESLALTHEQIVFLTALFSTGIALICIAVGGIADRYGVQTWPRLIMVVNSEMQGLLPQYIPHISRGDEYSGTLCDSSDAIGNPYAALPLGEGPHP